MTKRMKSSSSATIVCHRLHRHREPDGIGVFCGHAAAFGFCCGDSAAAATRRFCRDAARFDGVVAVGGASPSRRAMRCIGLSSASAIVCARQPGSADEHRAVYTECTGFGRRACLEGVDGAVQVQIDRVDARGVAPVHARARMNTHMQVRNIGAHGWWQGSGYRRSPWPRHEGSPRGSAGTVTTR